MTHFGFNLSNNLKMKAIQQVKFNSSERCAVNTLKMSNNL